jgi:predicted RNase H-like nuclease (RuvC/YqgF family)
LKEEIGRLEEELLARPTQDSMSALKSDINNLKEENSRLKSSLERETTPSASELPLPVSESLLDGRVPVGPSSSLSNLDRVTESNLITFESASPEKTDHQPQETPVALEGPGVPITSETNACEDNIQLELKKEIQSLQSQIKTLETQTSELQKANNDYNVEVTRLTVKTTELQTHLDNEASSSQKKIDDLLQEIKMLKSEVDSSDSSHKTRLDSLLIEAEELRAIQVYRHLELNMYVAILNFSNRKMMKLLRRD